MNIDVYSQIVFGDTQALKVFFLAHRFAHDQESKALSDRYGGAFSTFGMSSPVAEETWAQMMQEEPPRPTPPPLADWLLFHAAIHNTTFQTIQSIGVVAPDISVADFSSPTQFYDWLLVHQLMHDYERQALGLT